MSEVWRQQIEPEPMKIDFVGWLRVARRGLPLGLLVFGCLMLLLLVRLVERPLFGFFERLDHVFGDPWVLPVQLLAHHQTMHYWKNTGAIKEFAFLFPVVWEQADDIVVGLVAVWLSGTEVSSDVSIDQKVINGFSARC